MGRYDNIYPLVGNMVVSEVLMAFVISWKMMCR